jgi:aryl-alcohol dehydrogenase-like predicted oxidoreductase
MMRYANLGNSGLLVSRVSLGCLTFGARTGSAIYKVDKPEAARIVAKAHDQGVNLFDTSDLYADGLSEEYLGAALRGFRSRVVISSKAGFRTGTAVGQAGLSRQHLMRSIDDSLKRLGTDYIDLYSVHKEDPLTPLDETMRALDDIVRSGKARYVGFSNWSAWRAATALERQRQLGLAPFITGQINYSLVQRDAEYDLLPFMEACGVGAVAWSPLAGGFLTGKYDRAALSQAGSRVAISSLPYDREKGLGVVDALREIASSRGVTVAQAAVAWALKRPVVASALIGVSRLDQLDDLVAAADTVLTDAEAERLEAASPLPPLYPHWHIASSRDTAAYEALGIAPPNSAGGPGRGNIKSLAAQ